MGTLRRVMKREQDKAKVHLIDALPYVFRAYHALPSAIKDPAGRQSNALVGFASFLLKYIDAESPTHLALCWDVSLTSSFRNELYPQYKAQRPLARPELKSQIQRCRKLAEALGIPCFSDTRYEADDLLATLSTSLTAAGHTCVVVTSDKDMCQLVNSRVTCYDFAKDVRYNAAGVLSKMGVRPAQVPDFLGLAGDAVDNIPGVKGVGAKTAIALLAQFSSLESLYADLKKVASLRMRGAEALAQRLASGRDSAFLSRTLARLECKVKLRGSSLSGLKLAWPPPKARRRKLMPLLARFGLLRVRKRIAALE